MKFLMTSALAFGAMAAGQAASAQDLPGSFEGVTI